jgi:polyisoprenoid-binding protein YceI
MGRVLTALVLVGLAVSLSQADEVKLTGDNTTITFVGTKPKGKGKHDGGFKKVSGSATFNGTDATTLALNVDIDMNSTWTDEPSGKLTNHLKSADFFNVKSYPKAKFVSSKVEKDGDGYKVTGKLTLNGTTKELSFPAKIDINGQKLSISSTFTIDRHDWNVSYGKGIVDDTVTLKVAVNTK